MVGREAGLAWYGNAPAYAGTRPPKNGVRAWLSLCGRFEVKIISAPASSDSLPGDPSRSDNAPGDRRRRIDPVDRPWREPDQPIQQQRVMRAGQHDGVGAGGVLAVADEAGREFGGISRVADRRCRSERASASEARSAEPTSVTSQPWARSRISAWVYSRFTVPWCRAPRRAWSSSGAGRLDRRHRADKRHGVGGAQMRHHRADIVLQAITTRSGACAAISSPTSGTTRAMISSSLWWP